jgi:DNA invertase Pin-like site-specific DNA recombinase
MRMIKDAEKGYFVLIVTREVSRFARNTVDALQETRNLKRMGVEVYFTEDNIWTFNDEDGELKLTLMVTLAQNESKKLSQRIKAGQTITFQNGVFYGNGNILGYDKVGKNAVINEVQAEIVKYIYSEFLNGKGTTEIATNLEKKGAVTSTGLERWSAAYIARVLILFRNCNI